MRLIDADAFAAKLDEIRMAVSPDGVQILMELEKVCELINEQPTIDPVTHGEWLNDSGYDDWYCSECGFEINYDGEYPTEYDNFRFCGCCGAEMGGEKI